MFDNLTGADVAAAIAAVTDPAGLPASDALDMLVAAEKVIGWAHAVQARATLAVLDPYRAPLPGFDAPVEIGAALGATIRTGDAKANFAYGLSRLPHARRVAAGRSDQPRQGAQADHRDPVL